MDLSAKDLMGDKVGDGTYLNLSAVEAQLFEDNRAIEMDDYEHVMLPDYSGTYPVLKKEIY